MGRNTLTKVTVVNFSPKKYPKPICPPKLWSPVFCDGHVHKYQTQLCILAKLRKFFLWITSVYLNFRYSNFSHCRKPWLRKYLLHRHLQIFIQGRVFFKKIKQCLLLSSRCWYFRDRVLLSGQPLTYVIGKSQLKQ